MKLHFAFLQYPVIEFYSLSRSRSDRNRDSLIALAWLLETQNILTVVLRTKLVGGVLGAECSSLDPPEVRSREENFSYMNLFINIYCLYVLYFDPEVLYPIHIVNRTTGSADEHSTCRYFTPQHQGESEPAGDRRIDA